MKTAVITYFYNDNYLLRHWLRWHTRLFDHGILIDYDSTDDSVAICREMAPHWEVRKSKFKNFDVGGSDSMVNECVADLPEDCWKGALNVTEFLFTNDFRGYVTRFEEEHPDIPAFMTSRINAIETIEERERFPYTDDPFFFQILKGRVDPPTPTNALGPGRVFHRGRSGCYLPGHHGTTLPCIRDPHLYDVKFRWAPFKEMCRRIYNFRVKQTYTDYHTQDEEWWHNECLSQMERGATDLRLIPEYLEMLNRCAPEWGWPLFSAEDAQPGPYYQEEVA